MSRRSLCFAVVLAACGGRQAVDTTDALFASDAAARARELAPDLHQRAESAWTRAQDAADEGDSKRAEDLRTEARLWLAAAATEAERIEIERRRSDVQADEERWARQLARDQTAAAEVARDISRYEARSIALREAERLSSLPEEAPSENVVEALVTRARLNLAVAEALGASPEALESFDREVEALTDAPPSAASKAEHLVLRTEALIGTMRATWPAPLPGAERELVDTALALGFSADRTTAGVTVRSERFFTAAGLVSSATVQRFLGLLAAFPHGPVACQVVVPPRGNRQWPPRVAHLVERFGRTEPPSRVSTGMAVTEAVAPGTVQCTFAAYADR